MKLLTPYLLWFALTAGLLTIGFRFLLSYGIDNKLYTLVTLSAVIYGIAMFVSGWIFGKKDSEYLPIFDIGFRFHLTTYLIHNGISIFWVAGGFASKNESFSITTSIAFYWAIFLIIHFIFYLVARKRTIDSLDKEDIFE